MLGILEKVKGAAGTLAGQAAEACGAGVESARGILDAVAAASDDLEKLGYSVLSIEVAVGLPPGVTVFLRRTGEPTDEAFAAALANRAGQTTAWLLIKLVQQAHGWAGRLRFGGRECRDLAVDLGLRPAVRLLFAKPAVGEG